MNTNTEHILCGRLGIGPADEDHLNVYAYRHPEYGIEWIAENNAGAAYTSEEVDTILAAALIDVRIDKAQYAALESEAADVRELADDLMGEDGINLFVDIVDIEDMGAEARQAAAEMGWPVERGDGSK